MLDKFAKLSNKKKITLIVLMAWIIFVLTVSASIISDGKQIKDTVVILMFCVANLLFVGCMVCRCIYGAYKREDLLWFIGIILLIIGWIVEFFA